MRLEIMVVRSAGEALTDSRTEVFFELAVLDGDADQQAAMPPETMRTVAKKRSHILDFRAKSDMIEFGVRRHGRHLGDNRVFYLTSLFRTCLTWNSKT